MNTIDPSIWGPHYWETYHVYAKTYPLHPSKVIQDVAKTYIKIIPFTLPCTNCTDYAYGYINNVLSKDPDLNIATSSRKELMNFFNLFHNAVNRKLNK